MNKLLKSVLSVSVLASFALASGGNHWGYTGHSGPEAWGELSPKYKMCGEGKNQSPINISKDVLVSTNGLEKIGFNYNVATKNVINNGHTIQVNIEAGNTIHIDGKDFELKQFHFHTPSENHIEGKSFPLEAHFVHLDKDGNIAVIGVMFDESNTDNETLEKIWSKMPQKADGSEDIKLSQKDVEALMPKDKSYYRFTGSLTTPPCSEGVRWFVFKDALKISKKQVEEFLHVMHHPNNRPIQAPFARRVMQ